MDDISLLSEETISNKIYFIRGQKVMLDGDLALLYGIETKVLKQAVKRNLSRFPDDFMFELTKVEYDSSRSQIVTLKNGRGSNLKYLPYVFTEHGILMLSSVLKSDKAIQTNIQIMRIFTKVRQMFLDTTEIKVDILHPEASGQKKLENHDKNIELVFSYLDELTEKKENEAERVKIGYKK
ncbi:ORF6N domain-containing protein [Flavobacterium johnsoniae]|uniref:ORF6N domain-containing protein n=1 Tax=Flavobacterium johnsoniae TaxID=986 RepID=UPI0025B20100|nr:ORF6N domain-containing protein [Flavobacterium johnsoniae]WJS95780.1 ORF6N domain-containing protein [Flavobacterium johnsoniae]